MSMTSNLQDNPTLSAPSNTLYGMPKGSILIIWVEFWERFSFYGMLTLFVLFLTAPVAEDGFGWSKPEALGFLGVYTGLMYGMPVLGGYLADRHLGARRAVMWGTFFLMLGHFLMAGPAFLPYLIGGTPIFETLAATAQKMGSLTAPPPVAEAGAGAAYLSASYSFYLAITFLVIGNAAMKSTLVILLGDQFKADDKRKEYAFTAYYLSISVAGLLAGVTVGLIGQEIGWHYGFSIAGFGMASAFAAFWFLQKNWLAAARQKSTTAASDAAERFKARTIFALVVPGAGLCIFMTGWFHVTGSWVLFFAEAVDRSFFGLTMPETWLLPLNSAIVLATAPLLAWFWARMSDKHMTIGYPAKILLALALAALAHASMYLASVISMPGLFLPILATLLISLGEIIAWVPAYGYVYDTAPARHASLVMGLWYLGTLSLSGYLSGQIGTFIEQGGFSSVFGITATLTVVACIVLAACKPLIARHHQHTS